MKKAAAILISVVMLGVLSGCALLLGPGESAGSSGNLSITVGDSDASRKVITSGAELAADVLAALRYDLILTGPGGKTIKQAVSGGENLRLTAALGVWRIEARAYQGDSKELAGDGNLDFAVAPGANSIRVPMTMKSNCYTISIVNPEDAHGTATAEYTAAFPGTPVKLTVTPEDGYALKGGSLSYSDENGDHAIEANEDGSYAFLMPAAEITIHSRFNKVLGFAIEGPQDEMVAVSVDPPEGIISWAGNEQATFTVEDSRYSAEAGNLKWIVNGIEIATATGNFLVIRAQDYMRRTYALTALILENDQWYSGEYSFTVVE